MITVKSLTKCYGEKKAVDSLSFVVEPGVVTGFLGPNGAGKSTTMRSIVGLDRPTSGSVTVNGREYADCVRPIQEVGALLEAKAVHPSRSARNHLRMLAATARIDNRRVDAVLELAGLAEVAHQRAGSFSLGMGQRLGVAAALLGDPSVVILDEPVNGLDPEGVAWIRSLLRSLADEGRTVFLSSHLMSEMAVVADRIVVVGRGKLIADQTADDLVHQASRQFVRVRSDNAASLGKLLAGPGVAVRTVDPELIEVGGLESREVGAAALAAGIVLTELSSEGGSLEEAYMNLTRDLVEFASGPSTQSADPSVSIARGKTR